MKFNPQALGLALSVFAGGWWLIVMSFSLLSGVGVRTMTTLGSFHPFFTYSWLGTAVMVAEHLAGGFVIGWIFAVLYNRMLEYGKK